MKKGLIGFIAVIALVVVWFIGTQNNLVTLREDVKMQQSQIEIALQRRSDLIPNLVETVKGYAKHEETVFTEIAEARSKLSGSIKSGDLEGMSEANNALDSALSRLLVITENYPELQANEQFIGLQDELAGTENRIAVARNHYTDKVGIYNSQIQKFPTNIVASFGGFYPMPYFEADAKAQEVPVVNFD